jgi:hypothetical protein
MPTLAGRFGSRQRALSPRHEKIPWNFALISAVIFLVLDAILLGPIFFKPKGTVFTGWDMVGAVVPWFTFEHREFGMGHIPLWNPYYFCGTPFVANPQSACFYPFHWLLALLPVVVCVNVLYIVHFFLSGWITSLWCHSRGISQAGSILAGILFSFCGPFVAHETAGHLSVLETMAWTPLIFLCIDKIFDEARWGWMLLASAAIAMSVLSGCPQLTYYTALLVGCYSQLRVFETIACWRRQKRATGVDFPSGRLAKICAMLLLVYPGGAALSAVQLAPTVHLFPETVRSNGLSYETASAFPQTPENLLTLVAPNIFGGLPPYGGGRSYYGRGYPWEAVSFLGVGALLLAAFGAIHGRQHGRKFMAALAMLCLLLMLGIYTPLYDLLYYHLPMYRDFRVTSRFNVFLSLFVAVLAGAGLDALLQRRGIPWNFAVAVISLGLIILASSLWLRYQVNMPSSGAWGRALLAISQQDKQRPIANGSDLIQPDFVRNAGMQAARSLLWPAALLGTWAVLFCARRSRRLPRPILYLIPLLAVTELFIFARGNILMGPSDSTRMPKAWLDLAARIAPDDRVLSTEVDTANLGMIHGYCDGYGYDPNVLTRYAQFLASIQENVDPGMVKLIDDGMNFAPPIVVKIFGSQADPKRPAFVFSPRLGYLRCREIFTFLNDSSGRIPLSIPVPPLVHRLELITDWQVKSNRDAIFSEINRPGFDPTKSVLLESSPTPAPHAMRESGTTTIHQINSDAMEITADLPGPQILLITDSYAQDWRAFSLDANAPQQNYQVMPADYAFRAIPLAGGHHHFILEYAPQSFFLGRRVTLAALSLWLVAVAMIRYPKRLRQRIAIDIRTAPAVDQGSDRPGIDQLTLH